MNRTAQGIVVLLLGATALSSTVVTDLYLNYVQPAFRPFLIAAGVVLIVLGAVVVAAEARAALGGRAGGGTSDAGDPGHGHGAPRVAWLLLLPVVAVFVVAPPALGAYTAGSAGTAAPPAAESGAGASSADELEDSDSTGSVEMELQDFVSRAWTDEERAMEDRRIRLTGFAVPNDEGEGWYLARLQMACCAADAIVNRVLITDRPAPDEDSWWRVEGTWQPPEGELQSVRDHRFAVQTMDEVENPPDPYE